MAAMVGLTGSPIGAAGAESESNRVEDGVTAGKAIGQRYVDGPNGTVFTLTSFTTTDGGQVTVRTHGGIRSDGIGQITSHEPHFEVGRSYRMRLSEAVENGPAGEADGTVHRVIGGEHGTVEITVEGETAVDRSQSSPDNFVLLPFNWAWTLPDNPPVFYVNPNAPDNIDEVALVRQGFNTWENDPGSAMDWTFGGTTTVARAGNDGVNVVYWADTPDPADTFLARANTFYSPSTGNAFDTDIMFNNDFNWVDGSASRSFDVVSVAIHESGHSLGLDHAPDDAAIMYFSIPSGRVKRTLSLGDRGGVAAIYPPTADATVSGVVAFEDGTRASQVAIDLFTENRGAYLASAGTDVNGFYSFTLPGPGCYVITTIAPEGETFTTGGQYSNTSFCAAAGQAVNDINATLVSDSGTGVAGQVTTVGVGPLSGVAVDLFTENRGAYLASTRTGQDGNYRVGLPAAGCYVITFIAPTGQTFIGGGEFRNVPFCASAGQTVTGVDAEVIGQAGQATIGGTVTNPNGSGAAEAEAVLFLANGDGSRGQYLQSQVTGGDGRYAMTVAPGCYVVDLVSPLGRTWAANGRVYLQFATCLDPGGADLDIDGVLN